MSNPWPAQQDWYGGQYPGYYQYIQRPQIFNYGHQLAPPPPPPQEKPPLPSEHPPPPGLEPKSEPNTSTSEPSSPTCPSWYQAQVHSQTYSYPHNHTPVRFSIAPPSKTPEKSQGATENGQIFSSPPSNSTEAAARWNAVNSGYSVYQPPTTFPTTWQTTSTPTTNKGPRFPFKPTTNPTAPKSEPPKPATPEVSTPPKSQWPQEITDYVQRAFSSTDKPEEKDQMERILKEKLEYIFKNKIRIDWAIEPLPLIPSRAIASRGGANLNARSVNVLRPSFVPLSCPMRTSNCDISMGAKPYEGSLSMSFPPLQNKLESAVSSSPQLTKRRRRQFRRSKSGSSSSSQSKLRSRSHSDSRSRSSSASYCSRSSTSDNSKTKNSSGRKGMSGYSSNRLRSQEVFRALKYKKSNRSEDEEPLPVSARGGRGKFRRGRGALNSPSNATNSQTENKPRALNRGGKAGKRGSRAAAWSVEGTGLARLNQRANRFKDHLGEASSMSGAGAIARSTSQLMLTYADDAGDLSTDLERCKIVGTLQTLEKPYLRLTRAPDPSEVRPVDVLKKSLDHVHKKWKEKADYHWACEQFKSIRQDLTVQCSEDEFTAYVYETHADVALEAGDYEEFHQCQSQLMRLHKEGFGSSRRLEFTAYRILYYMFTLDFLGISSTLASFRPVHKDHPCVKFALDLRAAWVMNNYARFFRLLNNDDGQEVPEKCLRVVDWFLPRERREAAKTIFKVYRPTVSLSFVAKSLGFDDDVVACENFLITECGLSAEVLLPPEKIDGKLVWNAFCQAP